MGTETITKDELLASMRASGSELIAAARNVALERWREGRYEEGWTAKDILAHLASIEWTFPKILLLAEQPAPEARDGEKAFRDGLGGYNQRQVAKRADATVEELVEEFERNRAATVAAVARTDDALLRVRIRSAGGIEGTAAEVFNYLTVIHLRDHLDDIG